MWLANDAVSKLKGADSPISYQEFLNKTIGAERTERRQYAPEPSTHRKTGQEIIDEFMPIIEADRGR